MQRYGVSGLPTTVFLNGDGQVIHRFVGYKSFPDVMKEVEAAKSKLE